MSSLFVGGYIWGFNLGKDIEKVHTRFCILILKVKTPFQKICLIQKWVVNL